MRNSARLFGRSEKLPVPEECRGFEIKTESSICTGEKIIGFFNPGTRKLMYTELVRNDADIEAYYKKYGLKRK